MNRIRKATSTASRYMWRGKPCELLSRQLIRTSENEQKACCVIKLHNMELWKGLRLVDAAEVISCDT